MSIKDDNRRGVDSIWKQHVADIGQRAPEIPPYLQSTASAELYLNSQQGTGTAAKYYHAITLALQDNGLHKPHSSELTGIPERAAALQRHEYDKGDYDAFYFTKDDARRYGLNVHNFYRDMRRLVDLGMIAVIWQYDPEHPIIRKDGSHANGRLGKNTPRTIYALSDKWVWDTVNRRINETE